MPANEQHESASGRKSAEDEIVVFKVRRDTRCAECGEELESGRLLRVEKERPLCLDCADLGHLEFLPSGNTALTRRATKHSPLRAVVVQWSRGRNRYERQGILVTPSAIEQAEQECLADEEKRAAQRERAAERRQLEDQDYVATFSGAIRTQFPRCPAEEADRIAAHACRKHSGRVGRSAAAKEFDQEAIRLAVTAHVRHAHTNYDQLLMRYGDRSLARSHVHDEIQQILAKWQSLS